MKRSELNTVKKKIQNLHEKANDFDMIAAKVDIMPDDRIKTLFGNDGAAVFSKHRRKNNNGR